MPRNPRSLRLTDLYAQRLKAVAARVEQVASSRWSLEPDDFDGSYGSWRDVAVQAVSQAQRQNVRLTQGYLAAFIASETGSRTAPLSVPAEKYVGKSRDGRDLREAWDSPVIKAKVAVRDGKSVEEASDIAKAAALALVGLDTYAAARSVMADQLGTIPIVIGFRRVTVGATCGACMGAASGTILPKGTDFHVHPGCDCVAEPALKNVPDTAKRKTGTEIYNELTPAEQAARVGDEAAELIRTGEITLSDLVGSSPMKTEPDFITQKPLADLL
jgi:hypothetical protein